jgi:hypothetical protein
MLTDVPCGALGELAPRLGKLDVAERVISQDCTTSVVHPANIQDRDGAKLGRVCKLEKARKEPEKASKQVT